MRYDSTEDFTMPSTRAFDRLAVFESLRPELIALAYRMLGDVGRAQDMVQEAWLRWHREESEIASPKAFLITVVTRLCLNDLNSAQRKLEESRSDRLPEPVDLTEGGMSRLESFEQVSMAFMVVLERLTPAERAVLLLHDVFAFSHEDIAALVSRSSAACRKLLERAREGVSSGRRMITATREEHTRLLDAFVRATSDGDVETLVNLLADDALLITDGGREGRTQGRFRNLPEPLSGVRRIAAFLSAVSRASDFEIAPRELNGQPALVFSREGTPTAALLLAVADGKIQRVFFHADLARLRYLGPPPAH